MATETTPAISERQLEVLRLLAQGESPKEIACELGISLFTVRVHLKNTYERLGANHAAHAVALAFTWLEST
jgi:LuxR family maltose regulon positive regulatory protein